MGGPGLGEEERHGAANLGENTTIVLDKPQKREELDLKQRLVSKVEQTTVPMQQEDIRSYLKKEKFNVEKGGKVKVRTEEGRVVEMYIFGVQRDQNGEIKSLLLMSTPYHEGNAISARKFTIEEVMELNPDGPLHETIPPQPEPNRKTHHTYSVPQVEIPIQTQREQPSHRGEILKKFKEFLSRKDTKSWEFGCELIDRNNGTLYYFQRPSGSQPGMIWVFPAEDLSNEIKPLLIDATAVKPTGRTIQDVYGKK